MDKETTYFLHKAIEAAISGGKQIMNVYRQDEFGIEYKKDHSPVTIADKLSSKKIVYILKETKIPILSEEESIPDYFKRKTWKKLWIVDPLDGTKEFIKKNGDFCVNIGLVENKKPILGVLYIPVTNELFYGGKSIGSFKVNDVLEYSADLTSKAIELPNHVNKSKIVVTASRSHSDRESIAFFNNLKKEKGEVEFLEVGSAIKFCRVAEGLVDLYPRFNPCMEWDTAAGHALVQGMGKDVISTETNKPLVYNKEDLYSPYFIVK
jgi:3'(2'), 5'-bisphosphate nucleotidase